MVRFLKNKTRDVVVAESSTPSGTITSLRDIGVSVNQYGIITFTEATYDLAISSKYDDIVTMLTADTNNQNLFENTDMFTVELHVHMVDEARLNTYINTFHRLRWCKPSELFVDLKTLIWRPFG